MLLGVQFLLLRKLMLASVANLTWLGLLLLFGLLRRSSRLSFDI